MLLRHSAVERNGRSSGPTAVCAGGERPIPTSGLDVTFVTLYRESESQQVDHRRIGG